MHNTKFFIVLFFPVLRISKAPLIALGTTQLGPIFHSSLMDMNLSYKWTYHFPNSCSKIIKTPCLVFQEGTQDYYESEIIGKYIQPYVSNP